MKSSKLFDQLVAKSWWTILFILICLFTYDLASRKKVRIEKNLQAKLSQLEISITQAEQKQLSLQEQIDAQNDTDWIELTLMRKLGLVPENQQKVTFL